MAGIYLHIPFCKRICAYCDFKRSADLRNIDAVVEAMHSELDARSQYLSDRNIGTIYFGGGTPSLLSAEQLRGFLDHIAQLFDCTQIEEITLEANPDDLTPNYLAALREAGFNRLSIGIQSFDDGCLKLMNRRHTSAQAIEAVHQAQAAGFNNITADLIFGVDGYGGQSLEKGVDELLKLGVQHISAYHLTIEQGTAFYHMVERGDLREVDEAISEQEFSYIHDRLTEAGYEHYEVSNFALPGYRARHNGAYWSGVQYMGIGPAAHSFDGNSRRWGAPTVAKYLNNEDGGEEQLSDTDRLNEYVMTGLRTATGIDLRLVEERFTEHHAQRLRLAAEKFVACGVVEIDNHTLRIPPQQMLLSDSVIEALFEVDSRRK